VSALPIGCSLDGVRPARASVTWAEVRLGVPAWGGHPASALRGAIASQMDHVDFHGHADDGRRQARATVLYRTGPVRVWCYGPRAIDHAATVAGLTHLRLPSGDGCPVEGATVRSGEVHVGTHSHARWRRYESATPYVCTGVAWHRRPREGGPELRAWAGLALESSMRVWLEDVGCRLHDLHVQVEDLRVEGEGFRARWVSNAILPDGVGLGASVSEGWGEVRSC